MQQGFDPGYAWWTFVIEPIVAYRGFYVRAWHFLPVIIEGLVVFAWATISENVEVIPWWVWISGPMLTFILIIVGSRWFQILISYLGLPYILRGPNQDPIMELTMGRTARIFFRALNALGLGFLYWIPEYAQNLRTGVNPVWIYFAFNWLVFYFVVLAIDQAWFFRRTRLAVVLALFVWFSLITLLWLWFTNNRVICPSFLCPV